MLDNIGFYTLTDRRAKHADALSPMWRCEMLITDICNFKCRYCRGFENFSRDCKGAMLWTYAQHYLHYWIKDGLKNVRFSGGEPTLHPDLFKLVTYCERCDVERIAISTNGSAERSLYIDLLTAGINDFSISLDACCAQFGDQMAGTCGHWNTVVDNIKFLAKETYVTVGMVILPITLPSLVENIIFASSLGVADIRIISAAQWNDVIDGLQQVPQDILDKHPILKYRVNHYLTGRNVRGLRSTDSQRCSLVMDDSVIAGTYHFPCVIYLREGGEPIGAVGPLMRRDRIHWMLHHNTHEDPICAKNCLDVCIDYNNVVRDR